MWINNHIYHELDSPMTPAYDNLSLLETIMKFGKANLLMNPD